MVGVAGAVLYATFIGWLFIVSAASGTTLLVWPLFLLVGGVIMVAAGLRPRRPLPPEPDPYRAGEAPLAARATRPRGTRD